MGGTAGKVLTVSPKVTDRSGGEGYLHRRVDGPKGFPEAFEALDPRTEVQLCIVHLVRASLNYVPWKPPEVGGGRSAADLSCGHGGGNQAESERA